MGTMPRGYGGTYLEEEGRLGEGKLQCRTHGQLVHDQVAEEEGHVLLGRPGEELQGLVEVVEAGEGGRPVRRRHLTAASVFGVFS